MQAYSHQFVEKYDGLIGFGLDRETDEKTIICYLQSFSDDAVMAAIIKRLDDGELIAIFDLINRCCAGISRKPNTTDCFKRRVTASTASETVAGPSIQPFSSELQAFSFERITEVVTC